MTVARILRNKRETVFAVERGESFQAVVDAFAGNQAGAVVVLNEHHGIEGMISERDVVRALAGNASSALRQTADELMVRDVATCTYNSREADIMKVMAEQNIAAIPVVAGCVPIGLVSMADVMKLRLEKIALLMKEIEKECQMFCAPQEVIHLRQ